MNAYKGASEALSGHDTHKPEKKIKEIRHRHGSDGSHIFEHHHTHPEHHPMEEHTAPNDDAAVDHFIQHATQPNPGEAEADAGESGIPGESAAPAPTPGA